MADEKNDKTMFLYVGAYPDEAAAQTDQQAILDLHGEGWVGSYDMGIVTKDSEGKLSVRRKTDSTGKGARRGIAVGALLGIIFPPSLIVSGAVGAGIGAAIGHSFNDISKDELHELGEFIEDNQAALVVIGELRIEEMVQKAAKSALREYKKEFNADAKEFNHQLDSAIKAM